MKQVAVLAIVCLGGCAAPTGGQYATDAPQPYRQQPIWSIPTIMTSATMSSPQCLNDDRIAFAYEAVQTQLMEAALTCGQDQAYNVFVIRNQAALLDANRRIAEYFARQSGSDGQEQRDAYITDLANAQAQARGPEFCQSIAPVVTHALALTSAAGITQFVADFDLIDPKPTSCTGPIPLQATLR